MGYYTQVRMKEKNSTPFFSICIPTYNRSKYLDKALQSVIKQDFFDYEIVILDNNSTDDTYLVVERYQKITSRIIYIKNSKNVGLSRNLVDCFYNARGKYLFMLSDDDLILKSGTLSYLHSLIIKFKMPGYIKLAALFYLDKFNSLSDLYKLFVYPQRLEYISPLDHNFFLKIIDKQIEFMSGSVYKLEKKELNRLNEKDYVYITLDYICYSTYHFGGLIVGDSYILGRYFETNHLLSPTFFYPNFSMDTLIKTAYKYIPSATDFNDYSDMIRRQWLLQTANIKLFCEDKLMKKYIPKIAKNDERRLSNLVFYILAYISLLFPRSIIKIFKGIYQSKLKDETSTYIKKMRLEPILSEIINLPSPV